MRDWSALAEALLPFAPLLSALSALLSLCVAGMSLLTTVLIFVLNSRRSRRLGAADAADRALQMVLAHDVLDALSVVESANHQAVKHRSQAPEVGGAALTLLWAIQRVGGCLAPFANKRDLSSLPTETLERVYAMVGFMARGLETVIGPWMLGSVTGTFVVEANKAISRLPNVGDVPRVIDRGSDEQVGS